jgi:hypothetical protein
MKKASIRSLLLIVPVVIFIIQYCFIKKIYPLYLDSDPAYQYLLNGLLILNGHSPYHIDHPGTPVQTLIAGVLYVSWSIAKLMGWSNDALDISVGSHPERYLQIISYVLVVLNCTASYILGDRVLKSTNRMGLGIFVQACAVAFGVVFARMAYPEPESLLMFGSMLLVAVLAPSIFSKDANSKKDSVTPILTGLLCGFGVAVKLTFIPMVALVLLLKSPRAILLSFGAALVSWFFCVLPMIKALPRFFNWVGGIATHSGHYGSGKAEFIDLSTIRPALRSLTNVFDLWFLVALCLGGVVLGILLLRLVKKSSLIRANSSNTLLNLIYTPSVLLIVMLGQTMLVLKHPGAHYMVPALIIEAAGAAWMLNSLFKLSLAAKLQRIAFSLLSVVGVLLMLGAANSSYKQLAEERELFKSDMVQVQTAIAKFDNPILIGTYGCRLPQCAMSFGLGYAPATDPKVGALLTNFYDFNIWISKLVIRGHGFYNLDIVEHDLSEKRNVLLVTNQAYEQLKVFKLVPIFISQAQSIYQITGLNTQ